MKISIKNTISRKRIIKVLHSRAVFICLLMFICLFGLRYWRSERARDYYGFWVVGQAVRTMKLTNVYSDQDRHRIGDYYYNLALAQNTSMARLNAARERQFIEPTGTPFFYSLFNILSTGNYETDYEIFRILSLAVMIVSIISLYRMLEIPRILAVVFLLAFSIGFSPSLRDMLEGNVNQIQLGVIILILWLRLRPGRIWKELIAGICLGLLIMFKPNLALLFIFLFMGTLVFRSKKSAFLLAGGVGFGVGIGFLLPLAVFGKECSWINWLASFPGMTLVPKYMPRSFLGLLFDAQTALPFFVLMLFLILFPALIIGRQKPRLMTWSCFLEKNQSSLKSNLFSDIWMVGSGGSVYLLSSPFVHFHYFVLIVPLIAYALRPIRSSFLPLRKEALDRILMGIFIFLLFNIRTHHAGYPGTGIYFTYWPFAYLGTILLYGWALYDLARIYER